MSPTLPPIYLFEDSHIDRLYPITYSRSPAQLLCGMQTLLDRAKRAIGRPIAGLLVRDGIAEIMKLKLPDERINPPVSAKNGVILINARALLLDPFEEPTAGTAGIISNAIVWMHLPPETAAKIDWSAILEPKTLESALPSLTRLSSHIPMINRPWDLFAHQQKALEADFTLFGPAPLDTHSKPLAPNSVYQIQPELIHIAENVRIYPGVVLDASTGPIVIESGTEIKPNAVISGPTYIGKNCVIRTQADIRNLNSIGHGSRIGGEVMHSIILGNANKQHAGFMGQTVLGEWTNLGAGTTTSNLKNTYGLIKASVNGEVENTGLQFMGSIIGDHAKIGIGTYLAGGTVIGFASHVVIPRPPKFIPSFAWVTSPTDIRRIDFEKVESIARITTHRRHQEFTQADHDLFIRIAVEWSLRENYDWTVGY